LSFTSNVTWEQIQNIYQKNHEELDVIEAIDSQDTTDAPDLTGALQRNKNSYMNELESQI